MPKKLLKTFEGKSFRSPPIWLMRQAGRYLPEYQELRKKAGSFLNLCYNSDLAYEATMQPIRRFQLDGAILFSDILVIPHSLGFALNFIEGKGPIFENFTVEKLTKIKKDLYLKEKVFDHLQSIFKTLTKLRKTLPEETSLIGFCGAPWTVATYLITGKSSQDQITARTFAFQNPEIFEDLLNILTRITSFYLIEQIKAGAEIIQIFDSWSGVLDEEAFENYCIYPVAKIVETVKKEFPNIPIIAFPKGSGYFYETFAEKTNVNALSLDWTYPLEKAKNLSEKTIIQGNLDPLRLLSGGEFLQKSTKKIIETFKEKPFIFNLGHGILPETPISHVEELIHLVRSCH